MHPTKYGVALAMVLGLACQGLTCQSRSKDESSEVERKEVEVDENSEVDEKEAELPSPLADAPEPTGRLEKAPEAEKLGDELDSHFEGRPGHRMYLQVDKPLYRPGDTIWAKSWNLTARDLAGVESNNGIEYALIDPKGNEVEKKRVRERGGHAHVAFDLGEGARGGRYTLRAEALQGEGAVERPVVVASFEEPRIKKDLEFVRKAYGVGDEVVANLKLRRGTDEALENHPVEGIVRVDGEQHTEVSAKTNAQGAARVRFELPDEMKRGDGILTVQVEDGGVTESISRRIPIVLQSLQVDFYPEGGDLVEGLPSRIYFAAEKPNGDPADVRGRVENGDGEIVAEFESVQNGMGRFSLTPEKGRSYRAILEKPEGVEGSFELPQAQSSGCVMKHFDDFEGRRPELRVAVRCSESRRVALSAFMRNNPLDVAAVEVPEDGAAVVYLEPENEALANWQGVARVTLFDEELRPMAERLVYRRRDSRLEIEVEPDEEQYGPRDRVELDVRTKGPDGNPKPAKVALSVVDDKVVSFADDETPHMLTKLLLEPELPGDIDEPNQYFDREDPKSAYALDLLMGTRGYRRFEWERVLDIEGAKEKSASSGEESGPNRRRVEERPREHPKGARARDQEDESDADEEAEPSVDRSEGRRRAPAAEPMEEMAPRGGGQADQGKGVGAIRRMQAKRVPWEKVREFPVPDYSGEREGPRDDFRDTVFWKPDISTGNDGEATVSFSLSDAVTSFRVFAEGVGGGFAGRSETVFESSLPFSLDAKLPLEVSEGDRVVVPVTLSNEREETRTVELEADFGELLAFAGDSESEQTVELAGGERTSRYFELDVEGERGTSTVSLRAAGDGLSDELEREIPVAPRGFPREIAHSGDLEGDVEHAVDLSGARDGTVVGSVEVYPSPVSSMTGSLEGMVREPTGCFEQASSANYPNVMLMRYIQESGVAAPDAVSRAKSKMDRGYDKLVGYETDDRGFEWFGKTPPHEALTAYGLLQFTQMREVWGEVDPSMIDRTARWLMNRRNGEGGFEQDDKALDSFGRASEEVTNAYITYSLTEAGRTEELEREIDRQEERARDSKDAYILALATNTMLNADRTSAARAGVERLRKMQNSEGAWTEADHSITKSRGANLHVETTALATLALLEEGGHRGDVRSAVQWLNGERGARGTWGATQATILALQALTRYAKRRRQEAEPGSVRLTLDGETVGERGFGRGRTEPLRFELTGELDRTEHDIGLRRTEGEGALPYTVSVRYRTEKPVTSSDAPVALETELAEEQLEMGDTVRLTATVENRTERGLGMTLARVELPGGLTTQKWQLKELQEKGPIAFYETERREVILYFRQMKPGASKEVPLELKTTVPGRYTAQASRAYPYYNDTHKYWVDPVEVSVER